MSKEALHAVVQSAATRVAPGWTARLDRDDLNGRWLFQKDTEQFEAMIRRKLIDDHEHARIESLIQEALDQFLQQRAS